MHRLSTLICACALTVPAALWAADTDKAAREHEMLRRVQEALRQSQAESSDLTQQKTQAEEKLRSVSQDLESQRASAKSAQASLSHQLQAATAAQADLTQRLASATQQLAALTSKEQQEQSDLKERDAQLQQALAQLESTRSANSSCEAKNLQLYQYAEELAQRYQHKGVWAALAQKEPFTGIRQVGIENVLQEYHEKIAAQRVPPATH
ncbi:MAG: hypothetical protein JOZ67_12440 [Gammaproteobacteria bacterium]|nr:hypothetical protein [Gammaproteobacteria bacterium]MBV9695408.1 hypothetical protein [Gammaproteobacteria bacterium]